MANLPPFIGGGIGAFMRKQNNKGRSKSGPPFVMMRYDLMDSEAWRSLNAASRSIYLQIARRYNGQNNGFLGASIDCLVSECNLAPNTVTTALRRLIEVGLIVRSREASFACKVRLASEYGLTCYPCDRTGHKPSNAFKLWTGGKAGAAPVGLNGKEGNGDETGSKVA